MCSWRERNENCRHTVQRHSMSMQVVWGLHSWWTVLFPYSYQRMWCWRRNHSSRSVVEISVHYCYCCCFWFYFILLLRRCLIVYSSETLPPPPFRLAPSVLWCWSWEKDGRAVEVVPGYYAVHWKFSMCTATMTSSYSPVGPSVFLYLA